MGTRRPRPGGDPDAARRTRPFVTEVERLHERFPEQQEASEQQIIDQLAGILGTRSSWAAIVYTLVFGELARHLRHDTPPSDDDVEQVVRFVLVGDRAATATAAADGWNDGTADPLDPAAAPRSARPGQGAHGATSTHRRCPADARIASSTSSATSPSPSVAPPTGGRVGCPRSGPGRSTPAGCTPGGRARGRSCARSRSPVPPGAVGHRPRPRGRRPARPHAAPRRPTPSPGCPGRRSTPSRGCPRSWSRSSGRIDRRRCSASSRRTRSRARTARRRCRRPSSIVHRAVGAEPRQRRTSPSVNADLVDHLRAVRAQPSSVLIGVGPPRRARRRPGRPARRRGATASPASAPRSRRIGPHGQASPDRRRSGTRCRAGRPRPARSTSSTRRRPSDDAAGERLLADEVLARPHGTGRDLEVGQRAASRR